VRRLGLEPTYQELAAAEAGVAGRGEDPAEDPSGDQNKDRNVAGAPA
jgi:hypothetical protein